MTRWDILKAAMLLSCLGFFVLAFWALLYT